MTGCTLTREVEDAFAAKAETELLAATAATIVTIARQLARLAAAPATPEKKWRMPVGENGARVR